MDAGVQTQWVYAFMSSTQSQTPACKEALRLRESGGKDVQAVVSFSSDTYAALSYSSSSDVKAVVSSSSDVKAKGTSTCSQATIADVKAWIDAAGSINESNAIQYLKDGVDLFAELLTEGGIPANARANHAVRKRGAFENVQATLEDLLEFFERHIYLTGQMKRAEAAKFLQDSKCDEFRIQFYGRPRNDTTSSCGSTACKGKGKGKGKGADIGGQEFDEVCRFGRTLTDFERRCKSQVWPLR
ncbi:unnamed protein product [Prorocentrum cordatum]|uniref:Uncharacterized protein n=1 Tax=Prorocentrum cordatum TaxID=2364126 RepID=A0ABN9PG88_9DINO|nr:unnamed protein product [Polarella glacialis]